MRIFQPSISQIEDKRRRIESQIYENIELRNPGQYWSLKCFDYYKCIFIHIPKTAGISVAESLFGNYGGGHFKYTDYEKIYPQKTLKKYFKFTFVRNPISRTISAFNYLKSGGFHDGSDKKWVADNLTYIENVEQFVMEWLNEETMYTLDHFIPQFEFLQNCDGIIDVDYIGKLETLSEDFKEISKKLGVKKQLLYKNKTPSSVNSPHSISKEVKEKIKILYQTDFSIFKYL